ncbi:MAG: hypothetical protein JWO46_3318 [Nocardioidaceae bacterium]|nr:hypothetical protein [Nocardioidaceae bacterium]
MQAITRPDDWVPVEDRLWGMDRRALVPAVLVAVFGAFSFWLLPFLNNAVSTENPTRAGEVIQVGQDTQFAAASGWNTVSGIEQGRAGATGYPGTAQLTRNGVTFTVVTDTFDGSPSQLLSQIKRINRHGDSALTLRGQPETFTTTGGQNGAISKFTSGSGSGLLAAFVFNSTGVEVVAYGPTTIDADTQSQIIAMLESIAPVTSSGQGGS